MVAGLTVADLFFVQFGPVFWDAPATGGGVEDRKRDSPGQSEGPGSRTNRPRDACSKVGAAAFTTSMFPSEVGNRHM